MTLNEESSHDTCTAIYLTTKEKCLAPIPADGITKPLFCQYHHKQYKSFYITYKNHDIRLVEFEKSRPNHVPKEILPEQLRKSNEPYDFTNIMTVGKNENVIERLKDIHGYLWDRYILINRTILGRTIHHEHFFKNNIDLAHQSHLDKLHKDLGKVNDTLAALKKHIVEVRKEHEVWREWIRARQEQEDLQSAEARKLNRQAWENERRQAKENKGEIVDEKSAFWDPVESAIDEIRQGYINLLMVLLFQITDDEEKQASARGLAGAVGFDVPKDGIGDVSGSREEDIKKKREQLRRERRFEMGVYKLKKDPVLPPPADKNYIDGSSELFKSIIWKTFDFVGTDKLIYYDMDKTNPAGPMVKKERPRQLTRVIREYQLLRNIQLYNPVLAKVAMEYNSITEFLKNGLGDVRHTDIHDVVLSLKDPTMEDIRSALVNNEYNEEINKRGADSSPIDQDGQGTVYIKLCGRWLHQHPMNSRLSFHGWAQFQWITECSEGSAKSLSSSWEELHELAILTVCNYFQGWSNWKHDLVNEMSCMGFLQCTCYSNGKQDSRKLRGEMFCKQEGRWNGCSSGKIYEESRNWLIGHMSRNDHRVRRFLSMCIAYSSRFLIWVNDSKTGKVLYQPPKDHTWRARKRHDCKKTQQVRCEDWQTLTTFDEAWLKEIRTGKGHELMFPNHLEVIFWENVAGTDYRILWHNVMALLRKAWFYPDYLSHLEQAVDLTCRLATREHDKNEKKIRHDGNLILEEIKTIRKRKDSELEDHGIKYPKWYYYNKMDEYLDRKYTPWGKPNCFEELNGCSIDSGCGEWTEDIKRKFERENDDFWATFSKKKRGPESLCEGETATTVDTQNLNLYRRPTAIPDSVTRYWGTLNVKPGERMQGKQYYAKLYPDQSHLQYAMDRIMILWMQKAIEPSFDREILIDHHCFTASEKINNPLGFYFNYPNRNFQITIREPPAPNFLKHHMEVYERRNYGSWYSLCKFKSEPEYWPLEIDEADITNSIIADQETLRSLLIMFKFDDPHFPLTWRWKKLPKDYPLANYLIHEKIFALFMKNAMSKYPGSVHYCRLRMDCWLVIGGSEEEIKNRTAQMAEVIRNRSNGFKVKMDRNRSLLYVRADRLRELEDNEWL